MEGTQKSRGRVVQAGLRILLTIVALIPLGYTIYKEWPSLQSSFEGILWEKFAIAQILLVFIMAIVGVIPWASLRHLGCPFSYPKATSVYFLTQIFKYLPGGIWAFPGRMAVYQLLGVGSAQSVVSVFRETTAMFLGAALIGLLGLLQGLSLSKSLSWAIGLGTLVSAGAILIIQMPWFWRLFSSFKLISKSPLIAYSEVDPKHRNLGWLPWTLIGSVSFWFLFGLPFRQMALAIYPQLENLNWLVAASIFALAWCAGFVIVFVPAGIGIRESALTLLLVNIMPVGDALSLALLSRAAWIIAEGFWILITMIWVGRNSELSWDSLWQSKR